ncbi:two-component regulatory system sensor kinase [Caballeronia novacaledonica]|uniref:C4-dicarboxylate transport sensor protein DctB n=1 Tax=Caballeronia novacaledonica TaxID=1544861 RepID=A0A2U3IAN5_9BURK|nr:ATP-binding protein [Caballeronia novacaledonica]SPB17185.1 two-component regulatory system sensor kinase [Caballeronia novacaledonica]
MTMSGVPLWALAASLVLYLATAAAAVEVAWHRGVDALTEAGAHRLDLYAASLRSELGRYEILPAIAARQDSIKALLEAPPGARRALLPAVNGYLQAVNDDAGSVAVDVIDLNGDVIAASNWNQRVSFVGTNVAYRPYFTDSIAGGSGRFFGIGTNTGQPGLYFASAVRGAGKVLGATAVKISVDPLESAWRVPNEAAMVVDGNGVVVISTVPAWKFTALAPIAANRQEQIQASRQYAGRKVDNLGYERLDDWRSGAWFARLPDWTHPGRARRYLVMSRSAPQAGDAIMVALDLSTARRQQQLAFAFVTGAFLIAGLYGLYAVQRRRVIVERLKAQDALQRANDRLEATVQQRTAALQQEIEERVLTEQKLRDSQQELVHAGKLAVLGQMAAGLTHEINQPLVAIRTLCDNARTFFERGQPAQAIANLERVGKLVGNMAQLTAELKAFARKPETNTVPVALGDAVAHARLMYDARIRDERVHFDIDIAPDAIVEAEPGRLQQVIVNLLGNALDSLAGRDTPRIRVGASRAGDPARVNFFIADNGPGIDPHVLAHLFEPFVTTKPSGHGLGLGLAITSRIVEGFGARIAAVNLEGGGAQFTIEFVAANGRSADSD